jgi:peptidoglycan/LPS O-acetylase OafA/YrhL
MNNFEQARVRYDFLDWLRVSAIFVLLFYHTGMLFVGWDFHIQNAQVIEGLERPMDIAHRLRMPLLFVIAGAGMWYASKRRTAGGLMKERSIRLLVPLVAGMFIIVPPQVYVERLFRGQWEGGFLSFYAERVLQFVPYPQGDFSWHHLWFIVYLFVYVPILLPLLAFAKRRASLRPGLWLYALAFPLGLNEALLKPIYPETHALIGDWYVFLHYLLLTAYGVLLASMRESWDWLARHCHRTLLVSVFVTASILGLIEVGIVYRDTAADSFLANLFTWCWLLTFLGYGRRYLSIDNGALRWARDASYPIYILHQTVMLVVAYWVIAQPYSAWTKFVMVLIGTIVVSTCIYEVARRFTFTRAMLGMKPDRWRAQRVDLIATPQQ